MKKILALLFLLFLIKLSLAQIPAFVWAKSIDAPGTGGVTGRCMAIDAVGNTYISGEYIDTHDFDPGAGVSNLSSVDNCCGDVFILKLDVSGNFVWAKSVGGTNFERSKAITVDANGNSYITGTFGNTVDFDPGPGVFTLSVSGGGSNSFITKLDPSGNFVWAKQFAGAGLFGAARGIAVDNSGNVYTTGEFSDSCDFDPGINTFYLYGDTTNHCTIFVTKLDPSGNFLWAEKFGPLADMQFNSGAAITTDATGNIYFSGKFGGTVDFDPGPSVYNLVSNGGFINESNAFVCKLNSSGNFIWAKGMGYSTAEAVSLKLGAGGKVYTTGGYYGVADFDPGAGVFNLTSAGANDIFVSALDVSGNFVWAKSMGGTNNDESFGLATDPAGNVYTTGRFRGTVDLDPGPASFSLTAFANDDIFVSKLDAQGNFLNAGQMGGTDGEIAFAIAADNIGNVYTTGYYRSAPADFDPGPGTYTFSNAATTLFESKLCTTPNVPVNSTSVPNLTLCSGATTTLSAASVWTVNWYSSPTSTTILYSGTNYVTPTLAAGTHTYYAEAKACSANPMRTAITVTAIACVSVGVTEQSEGVSYQIFPNPTTGYFELQFSEFSNLKINIYSVVGNCVRKKDAANIKSVQLDLSEEANGIYFVEIISDKERSYKKIIKN
jgi:hypothetical protein